MVPKEIRTQNPPVSASPSNNLSRAAPFSSPSQWWTHLECRNRYFLAVYQNTTSSAREDFRALLRSANNKVRRQEGQPLCCSKHSWMQFWWYTCRQKAHDTISLTYPPIGTLPYRFGIQSWSILPHLSCRHQDPPPRRRRCVLRLHCDDCHHQR